jgi:hypothetical protein
MDGTHVACPVDRRLAMAGLRPVTRRPAEQEAGHAAQPVLGLDQQQGHMSLQLAVSL